MKLPIRPLILFASATALLALAACGGGDTSEGSPSTDSAGSSTTGQTSSGSSVAATEAPRAPGRILVSSSTITGQKGKLLIITGPTSRSGICVSIDSDSWSLDEAPLIARAAESGPCDVLTDDAIFEPGEHILSASLFTPGIPGAERTAAATVELIDGDVRIELDGSKLSEEAEVGGPGRVLVTVSEITGQKGKILVVLAQGNIGSVCAQIDSNNWSLPTPTAMTQLPAGDQGPCGDNTPESTFQPGDQVVIASVFVPGTSDSPDTVQTIVTIEGDATLALDGSTLSAN